VPTGATVTIDGDPVGVTPLEITLAPKRYTVRVAHEGYDTIESEEEVRAERASVVLQLQKSTGKTRPRPGAKAGKPVSRERKTEPLDAGPGKPPAPKTEPKAAPPEPKTAPKTEPKTEPKTVRPPGGTKPNPY
jgi:hypothetical protein